MVWGSKGGRAGAMKKGRWRFSSPNALTTLADFVGRKFLAANRYAELLLLPRAKRFEFLHQCLYSTRQVIAH